MKKLLVISGVLTIIVASMQSCAPKRMMPRPQRHPRPPHKMAMHQMPVQTAEVTVLRAI